MDITEIIKATGLKEPFIRKCLKEMKAIFEPHVKRGDHNSLVFSDNARIIFDQIKQLKEQGNSLPSIKQKLFKEAGQTGSEGEQPVSPPDSQTYSNRTSENTVIALPAADSSVLSLMERAHKAELSQEKAEHELMRFKDSLGKYLPAGGEPADLSNKFNSIYLKLNQIQFMVEKIEKDTWSKLFGGHSPQVKKEWNELKEVVQECLKS